MSYLQTEAQLIRSHQSGNLPPLSFSLLLFPLSLPPTHLPLPPHFRQQAIVYDRRIGMADEMTCKQNSPKNQALRRLLTNDNLRDGELSYLTPNNICAGQSCGQFHFCFHFCRRLDICRQLDSVHSQEYKSDINVQGVYLLIHFITDY
jgi:hypothetical protein